jgi:RecJ-like exonuclease
MPARLIDCPCDRCGGSGNAPCARCNGTGYVVWGTCWGCHGQGEVVCPTCGGKKCGTLRTWVPDSLQETLGLLQELEEAVQAEENGWVLVNALRRAYRYSRKEDRDRFFPKDVIDRIIGLEKRLPEPCSHCHGQASEFASGKKCVYCRGSGFAKSLQ